MKSLFAAMFVALVLAACGKSSKEETLSPPPPPPDAVDFATALEQNRAISYANFIAKHPGSRYYKLAIELYTEASILGDNAAPATVDNAREALQADVVDTAQQ